ncbi:MAG: protein kinase [Verrucomicrobia bacterium]|nr:protein kinase [Verrucomicrobiota bacterium]
MLELRLSEENRGRVAEFQRKHHIGLLTLVFAKLAPSDNRSRQSEDSKTATRTHELGRIVRKTLSQFAEADEISASETVYFIVFAKPSDAAKFALAAQAKIRASMAEAARDVACRVAIHVGEVVVEEQGQQFPGGDLYTLQADIAARLSVLARDGQILLTRSAFDNARQVLRGEELGEGVGALGWMNYGPYRLEGVDEPLEICEVGELAFAPLQPPSDSKVGTRHLAPDQEPVLGWRPAIGQVIPNAAWRLEEKLGEGGFGEVWLVRHQTLQHLRVSKFCFRADRVRTLKREATIFRVLKEEIGIHPGIVGIQDVYFDQPPFYIIMDYAEGKDLRAWCQERGGPNQVPLPIRLEVVAQIAEALHAAHSAGVIHRDIKPSNVIISEERLEPHDADTPATVAIRARLTDFGIGQVLSQEVLEGLTHMGFTQTMMAASASGQVGTQVYLAPELMVGQPASIQSDIYSLGVLMWQLLVGDLSRPLTSDWSKEISDPLLRMSIMDCVAGHPSERLSNARQLARSLRSLEFRPGTRKPDSRRTSGEPSVSELGEDRSGFFVGTVALIVILVIFLIGIMFSPPDKNADRHTRLSPVASLPQAEFEDAFYLKASTWGFAEKLKEFLHVFATADPKASPYWSSWKGVSKIAQSSVSSDLFLEFCHDLASAASNDAHVQVRINAALAQFYAYRGENQKGRDYWARTGFIDVTNWFAIGPFSGVTNAYDTKFIQEEVGDELGDGAPYATQLRQVNSKRCGSCSLPGFIDFKEIYTSFYDDSAGSRVAYAWTSLRSPEETVAQLRFTSDDLCKLWLNGRQVFAGARDGTLAFDQEVIPAKLQGGTNMILVKACDNWMGQWGFCLRITHPDGSSFSNLQWNGDPMPVSKASQ